MGFSVRVVRAYDPLRDKKPRYWEMARRLALNDPRADVDLATKLTDAMRKVLRAPLAGWRCDCGERMRGGICPSCGSIGHTRPNPDAHLGAVGGE